MSQDCSKFGLGLDLLKASSEDFYHHAVVENSKCIHLYVHKLIIFKGGLTSPFR